MISDELKESLVSIVNEEDWDKIEYIGKFREGGSNPFVTIFKLDQEIKLTSFDVFKPHRIVKNEYKKLLNTANKFNYFKVLIDKELVVTITQEWRESDFIEQKNNSALVFYDWINERMMSIIYENEFPNGPTAKDIDGDPLYESTWEEGKFTFRVEGKYIKPHIILIKDGIERVMNLEYPDFFFPAILEHHEITNTGELKDLWKPWDTIKLISPHNTISILEKDKRVFYFDSSTDQPA